MKTKEQIEAKIASLIQQAKETDKQALILSWVLKE